MARKWYHSRLRTRLFARFRASKYRDDAKKREELAHWIGQALQRDDNDHFDYFYTEEFLKRKEDYSGKRLLDVGCGPTGSLEWADNAAERVGLDPLAAEYLRLGAGKHRMRYVAAPAEAMPFGDDHFDVVFSFNALDHVDDLDRTCREIDRVLKPGGEFLLITDVNHPPTVTEPAFLPIDLIARHFPAWEIRELRYFKHTRVRIYDSLREERVELAPEEIGNGSCILKADLVKQDKGIPT